MVTVENLTKNYGQLQALKGVSFKVRKGEIFGLLGPNGAGKTTIIKILTGQIMPASGSGKVAGFDIYKQQKQIKTKIGVVFEEQNLYERLSPRANLELFQQIYRLKKERISQVLEEVGLTKRADDTVKNLSRGLKQRLLIVRAILNEPTLLFLDEPTNGLDPYNAKKIRQMIISLAQKGTTIFLTTHYLEEAENICQHIAIINSGKIIVCDTVENIILGNYQQNSVKLAFAENNQTIHTEIPLQNKEELACLLKQKNIISVHSQEPSLEDVFIKLTRERIDEFEK